MDDRTKVYKKRWRDGDKTNFYKKRKKEAKQTVTHDKPRKEYLFNNWNSFKESKNIKKKYFKMCDIVLAPDNSNRSPSNLDVGRNKNIPYYGWRLFFPDTGNK